MKIDRLIGVGALACVVGCAGASPEAASPRTGAKTTPAFVGESSATTAPAMAPMPAPPAQPAPAPSGGAQSSASAAERPVTRDEAERSPSQRPGLGTEWGETRRSPVHDVAFFRSDTPPAIATLHYDDRAGIEALASYHAAKTLPLLREVPAANGAITVSIRNDRGAPLEARRVGDRTYVVGHAGERYVIVLSNRTRHRFEAVATVDGLDVINGQPGSVESRGYLLQPYASLQIDGFRQSQDDVAAFRFGRVADSYAAQTGSARDVGVIGVAFFAEQGDRFDDDADTRARDTANPFPSDSGYARPPWSQPR